jgi:electron transfer flavoprotein beta subunit
MRGIMAARSKPLKVVEPNSGQANTQTTSFELPAPKGACKLIDVADAGKLIDLLHNEAKII